MLCKVLDELRVDPTEHPVLCTFGLGQPSAQQERLTQLLVEVFRVPAVYLENPQTLALYASGRTTGVVVDVGDTNVQVVPVYEGYALPHAVQSSASLGGREVTDYLLKIMMERGYSFTTTAERDIVVNIKETLCFVAPARFGKHEQGDGKEVTYELPDGNVISIANELHRAPEVLFQPSFIGSEVNYFAVARSFVGNHHNVCSHKMRVPQAFGLADLLFEAIMKCDVDIRKDLFGNVVLAGGGSCSRGLAERLQAELTSLAPSTMRVKVRQTTAHHRSLLSAT